MSTRTRIKICGVRTLEAALCAAQAGADAVGFVFVGRSPRAIEPVEAAAIVRRLPSFVEPVALFVDATAQEVRDVCTIAGLHTAQLHGHETLAQVEELASFRIIKAINFGDESQMNWLRTPPPATVAAILVDGPAAATTNAPTAKTPAARDQQLTGGSGEPFDWTKLAPWISPQPNANDLTDQAADTAPIILAGGLTPENVGQAIATVRPWAVDVSSGVESSRGIKSLARIRAFCAAVQHADAIGR